MATDVVMQWNAVALNAVAIDHTPAELGLRRFSDQPGAGALAQAGPTRAARALAIVHAAIYDAVNSVDQTHTPYLVQKNGPRGASLQAAAAQAAHDTLVALYPRQTNSFDVALRRSLAHIPDGPAEIKGVAIGNFVANKILEARKKDGSQKAPKYIQIREADVGTGPSGLGDGNPWTTGDVNWRPLGAPSTNSDAPNFTPPFPAYTSGHATFGAALFQTLTNFYGADNIVFTFTSDELNGINKENSTGAPRSLSPRSFTSFSQASEENGQSRIYLGIHWSFDKTEGIKQGNAIADWVFNNYLRPVASGPLVVAMETNSGQVSMGLSQSASAFIVEITSAHSFSTGTETTYGIHRELVDVQVPRRGPWLDALTAQPASHGKRGSVGLRLDVDAMTKLSILDTEFSMDVIAE